MRWFGTGGTTVPVLRLAGPIGMATPLRPSLSLQTLAAPIERAFSDSRAPAVAIVINSPGGSPVQSRLIYKRIRAHADEKRKPVYIFAEDVMASGGYLVALAGDEIYADENSIIGSIGVVSASFGLDKAIAKLGVDRRVYTAGVSKMALDPFQPEKPEDVERLKVLQKEVHETFIALVKERRKGRIDLTARGLFEGEFWSGERAKAMGLIDGLGDIRAKMRERYGSKVKLKPVPVGGGWLRRRLGPPLSDLARPDLSAAGGVSLAVDILSTLEARALWSRFGL
jgi:signal peptide peptidase SppA